MTPQEAADNRERGIGSSSNQESGQAVDVDPVKASSCNLFFTCAECLMAQARLPEPSRVIGMAFVCDLCSDR